MRYIKLNQEEIEQLEYIEKRAIQYRSRHRAQALLLSNKGEQAGRLAEMLGYSLRTIYRWFDRFDKGQIEGIHDLKGRGRKPTLNRDEHAVAVKSCIKKNSI